MRMLTPRWFDDVAIGENLPELARNITHDLLVRYSGAVCDFNPIHTDAEFARSCGLAGPIAHGLLSMAFVNQMVVDWLGDPGALKQLCCRFTKPVHPGDTVFTRGVVIAKQIVNGQHQVHCAVWVENQHGERVVDGGLAVTVLPAKE